VSVFVCVRLLCDSRFVVRDTLTGRHVLELIAKLIVHNLVNKNTKGINLISDRAYNKFTADRHDWHA
jgi:hypothetical protein